MKKLYGIFAVLFLFLSIQAFSKDYKFTAANLMVTAPANWTVEQEGEVVILTVNSEEIAIVFTIIHADALDKALEAGIEEIQKQYSDLKLDDVKEETLEHVTVVYTDGKAKRDDGSGKLFDVELTVALVPGSNDNFLFIHGVATTEALNKFSKDIGTILNSLKPIK